VRVRPVFQSMNRSRAAPSETRACQFDQVGVAARYGGDGTKGRAQLQAGKPSVSLSPVDLPCQWRARAARPAAFLSHSSTAPLVLAVAGIINLLVLARGDVPVAAAETTMVFLND